MRVRDGFTRVGHHPSSESSFQALAAVGPREELMDLGLGVDAGLRELVTTDPSQPNLKRARRPSKESAGTGAGVV